MNKKCRSSRDPERASVAAMAFPFAEIVRLNVANATEGAAPNKLAKLLGYSTFPRMAKHDTTAQPIKEIVHLWF
jgi:hypothetical protein